MPKLPLPKEVQQLITFLNCSPSAWHAVEEVKGVLSKNNFVELKEEDIWKLKSGGKHFVIRNGSSLLAFILPSHAPQSAVALGAHTDSPGLKLKPNAEFYKDNMRMLGVEIYGGPLLNSWLNRDLGIAGRILYADSHHKVREALVRLDAQPVTIPQLAIHLDRKVNDEGLVLNKQEHLSALAGFADSEAEKKSGYLETLLKNKFDVRELLAHDLFLFPLEEAKTLGLGNRMLASFRLDNLASVLAAVQALTGSSNPLKNQIKMIALWDNEEIGSSTAQGAASPFLPHVLERIFLGLGKKREDFLSSLNRSLCISLDVVHAAHPNYPDKHEPRHQVLLEKGAVLKFNAQHRYATDMRSAEPLLQAARKCKINLQKFTSRGDIPGGSTIGPIHAASTGMPTADLGIPQLSMHSARELIAWPDYLQLCSLLKALWNG